MLPHGNFAPDVPEADLKDALLDSHRIRTKTHIHDGDENRIATFDTLHDSRVLSGSVQVDGSQDVSRSLEMVILDARRQLSFTKNNPAYIGVYAEHFVSVTYGVLIPNSRVWVNIPVFWGPITEFSGNSAEITLEAQGKEALGLAPNYFTRKAFTLDHKTKTHDAITKVFNKLGERRYRLPDLSYKIGAKRVITPQSEPWKILAGGETDSNGNDVQGLIESTGKHPHHAFYDGLGQLTVHRLNKQPCWVFGSGQVASDPQYTFDATQFVNHVVVTGATPKGKGKTAVIGRASLPAGHPLSPQSLARHGEPRYMTHYASSTSLKTVKACQDRAHHLLEHFSKFGLDVSFDCLPIPMLEPHDRVAVSYRGNYVEFPLIQYTIPLTHDSLMSIGGNAHSPTSSRASESQTQYVKGPKHPHRRRRKPRHRHRHHKPHHRRQHRKPVHHKPHHKPMHSKPPGRKPGHRHPKPRHHS